MGTGRRYAFAVIVAVLLCAIFQSATDACAQAFDPNRHGVPGMRQADRHNPFAQGSSNYPSGSRNAQTTTIISGTFGYPYGYPLLGYPYYAGNPYTGYPYEYYDPYYINRRRFRRRVPVTLPPVVLPADALFGPRALERFFNGDNAARGNAVGVGNAGGGIGAPVGGGNAAGNAVINNNNRGNARGAANNNRNPNEPRWAREVSQAQRERAWRLIDVGDRLFIDGEYAQAAARYRSASRSAPRIVESYLKQAQAMIAESDYDEALKAYEKVFALTPLWKTANFSLAKQYGENGENEKLAHLDQLAATAEKDPNNANLLLLIGMELYFDGQRDRAVNFLRRAEQLGGGNVELPGEGNADRPIPNPPQVRADRDIF